ncbi:MAG: hypothetical protein KC621_13950 [Myxococcales bacterium]|nr:hypothetical protein [Myxococcales bacterium]
MRTRTTVVVAVLLAGCGNGRSVEQRQDEWLERMDAIDAEAVALRDEVVQGDISSVKAHARKLKGLVPTEGRPALVDTALAHLEEAGTVRDASQAVGELTQGCRACHAANHASLAMRDTPDTKPTAGAVAAEMERHRALVDGIWFTMIGGPPEALQDAVTVLDQGSLTAGMEVRRRLAPDLVLGPPAEAIDRRVHDLAHEIRDATWDHRPPLYADLLTTCASCHELAKTRGALTGTPPADPVAMNAHFVDIVTLELAVVGGELESGHAAAKALAKPPDDLPDAWKPSMGALTSAARAAAEAKDLDALGQATADVLVACGRCHTATGGGPKEAVEPPPGADAPEMAKHLYAAYWMGHGLLATNDEAWTRGAEALADAPLAAPGGVGAEDEARVHALAKQALPITEPTERAKAFGQLLSSCSPCHVALLNDP